MGAQSRKPYIQVNTLAPNQTCLAVPARVVLVANARVTSRSRTVPGATCQQIWAAVTGVALTWVAVTWVPVPLIWAVVLHQWSRSRFARLHLHKNATTP